MVTRIIKGLIRNIEDLHYPFLILDDDSKIKVSAYYLNFKYPRNINGDLDLIGKWFSDEEYFNFCRERAKKECLPIIIKALKEDKKYSKLSLQNKRFYEILKQYNLIEELKGGLKE